MNSESREEARADRREVAHENNAHFWQFNVGHVIAAIVLALSIWTQWLISHDDLIILKRQVQDHDETLKRVISAIEIINSQQRGISDNQLRTGEILKSIKSP